MKKEYKNVLIEIDDKDLSFENPVKVLRNHQSDKLIGLATLTNTDSGLYADIVLNKELPKSDYFPSLGFIRVDDKSGKIINLGICDGQNIDSRIPKL